MSTKSKNSNNNVEMKFEVLDGVKLSEEKKKGGATLWSLADGEYIIRIIARRPDFKGGKAALVTTEGITTIAGLFSRATQEVQQDHTDPTSGDFRFSENYALLAKLSGGTVTELSKAPNKN